MKALSIKQPWLWAILELDKRIENRTWKPPKWIWIIGQRIALHASKGDDRSGFAAIHSISGHTPPSDLPRGAIVATARIAGWVDDRWINDAGYKIHSKWFVGPVGWILEDVQKLEQPILCRGALGLWDVPGDVLEVLQNA